MYRSVVYGALLASGLLVGVGCNRTDTKVNSSGEASREATGKAKGVAFVRYISAIDAHSGTDLYFGDLRLFNTSAAEKPTGYKEVPAERRDFALREAGKPDGMEIEKNSEGLSAGKHYTVVGYEDEKGNPILRVFNDDESAPAAGKAKVRLIHAASGAEPISLWAPGGKDKLVGESRFSATSGWENVDAVNGPLEIRAGNDASSPRVAVPTTALEAGRLYTFVVEGGPKSGQKLRVVDLVDQPRTD